MGVPQNSSSAKSIVRFIASATVGLGRQTTSVPTGSPATSSSHPVPVATGVLVTTGGVVARIGPIGCVLITKSSNHLVCSLTEPSFQ